ncbi:MAG TPA: hypothetical protein DDZ67_14270 [Xanthomonadaceae bacterium]|nr:hypothetical protein [Xanthomonadaceae bacterium]
MLEYNVQLQEGLYPQSTAAQATTSQKVLAVVGGGILGAADFGRETVESTVSLVRNFIASGMYQWGMADRLGVQNQAKVYHEQLGETVANVVGLASWDTPGKIWGHYANVYSQSAALWEQGDVNSVIAASRLGSKASIEIGSTVVGGGYGAFRMTVGGIRMAGSLASGTRALLASIDGPAMGTWRAQLGAVGDLDRVRPFALTQSDMIRADVGVGSKIDHAANTLPTDATSSAHRLYLNQKFERTGNIDLDINIRARQQLARGFYEEAGFSGKRLESHLRGIDYSQDVSLHTLSRGRLVEQWQPPGGPVGNYFTPVGSDPFRLGMDALGRERLMYAPVQRISVLRSTAADIPSWKEAGIIYRGGGAQYFTSTPDIFKLAIGGP